MVVAPDGGCALIRPTKQPVGPVSVSATGRFGKTHSCVALK